MDPIYVVTEIKTVADQSAVLISSTQHSSRNSAESLYYSKLAAAANPDNTYPKHAVLLATNEGFVIDSKCYTHEQPEPEPDPTESEAA